MRFVYGRHRDECRARSHVNAGVVDLGALRLPALRASHHRRHAARDQRGVTGWSSSAPKFQSPPAIPVSTSTMPTGFVSRGEILRSVWHTEHEGSNVIEAAISSLRRKLGPEAHRLETVRGVGYRLRAGQCTRGAPTECTTSGYASAASMFLVTTSIVRRSSSVGLNSTSSVPA